MCLELNCEAGINLHDDYPKSERNGKKERGREGEIEGRRKGGMEGGKEGKKKEKKERSINKKGLTQGGCVFRKHVLTYC